MDYIDEIKILIASTNDRPDVVECYSRKNCLLVHGVPEELNENIYKVVTNFVANRLQMHDIDFKQIDNCHRLGPKKRVNARKSRSIIIRRYSIFYNRAPNKIPSEAVITLVNSLPIPGTLMYDFFILTVQRRLLKQGLNRAMQSMSLSICMVELLEIFMILSLMVHLGIP